MPDHVLLEDRDVPLGSLNVQVSEQCRANVDGQPVVDQVGSEEPSEIVRGEMQSAECWICLEPPCQPPQLLPDLSNLRSQRSTMAVLSTPMP